MNRREFLGLLAAGGAACFGLGRAMRAAETAAPAKPILSFGVVADVQYADIEPQGKRKYRESPNKLLDCVRHLNDSRPDFVIHLGDMINGGFASYDAVLPIYEKLTVPHYHVAGNHDLTVDAASRDKVFPRLGLDKLGQGKGYYDFARGGWRFIVLNGIAVSIQAHAAGTEERKAAEAILADLKKREAKNAKEWNGAVGPQQREWLKKTLAKAAEAGEKSIVFCHFPIYPAGGSTLWDGPEVAAVLESAQGVAAYLAGHVHAGGYAAKNGIHYLTLKGMIENDAPTYALVEVYPDRLQVTGFGAEPTRTLRIGDGRAGSVGPAAPRPTWCYLPA